MLPNLVEYHWAEHIDDALLLLGRLDTKTVPLAGGTYLLGTHDENVQAVVDLRDLGLAYITENVQHVRIGSMTSLQLIAEAPALKEIATGIVARSAFASSSSRLIRNSATIGGTLGAGAASQADLLTTLVAMDAWAIVRSGSKTQVNLSAGTAERPGLALAGVVFKGKQERRISCSTLSVEKRPNELIVEVVVPCLATNGGASFLRIGRTPTDVALLNVVALVEIENGLYRKVRIAFGGINMTPVRMSVVEQQLEGQEALQDSDTASRQRVLSTLKLSMKDFLPPNDLLVSSSYRRVAGMRLAYRALEEATRVSLWHGMVSSEATKNQLSSTRGDM
jgi:CO/xanthine dehydrogenase FAD-binding subunit